MTERLTRAQWEARLVDERNAAQARIREERSRGKERLGVAIEAIRVGNTSRAIALLSEMVERWDDGFDVVVSRVPVDVAWKADFVAPLRIELRMGNAWFAHEEQFDLHRPVPMDFVMRALVDGVTWRLSTVVAKKAHARLVHMFSEGKLS